MQTFDNVNIYSQGLVKEKQTLTIANGSIANITSSQTKGTARRSIVPGFIDLQIYGAAGRLFSANPTMESIRLIEDQLLQEGTTGFLICLATNTPEVFNRCISVIKSYGANARNCLGLHLEGPFIHPEKRGAHVKDFIRKATLDEIKQLLDFGEGTIKMMTLAPELQDEKVITYLLDHGVIVSLGHSNATFEQATHAYDLGIPTTTHLFNAMSPIQHRAPGIPTAVFNHPSAMASIIADGLHVDFEMVKLASKIMRERLFLITDAVTECHTGPYQHRSVGDKFVMPDGTLSGSSLSMLQAIKNCIAHCDISLTTAINMASYYPSKLLHQQDKIGNINIDAQANFVVMDNDMSIEQVFFKGEEIKLN